MRSLKIDVNCRCKQDVWFCLCLHRSEILLVSELLWWWCACDDAWDRRGFMLWGGYVSIASFCRKASSLRRLANQLYTRTSVTRLDPSPWALEGDTPLCIHSALKTTVKTLNWSNWLIYLSFVYLRSSSSRSSSHLQSRVTCCIPPPAPPSLLCWGSSVVHKPGRGSPETPDPIWNGFVSFSWILARPPLRAALRNLPQSPDSVRHDWILGKKTGPDPDWLSHCGQGPEHGRTLRK